MTGIDLTAIGALALKSFVITAAALLLLQLMRGRSADERSAATHLALLALTVLPLGTLLLPAWNPMPAEAVAAVVPAMAPAGPLPAPVAEIAPAAVAPLPQPEAAARIAPETIVGAVYALPLLLLLATMFVAVARLFAMRRRALVLVEAPWLAALAQAQRRMGFKHGTALLVSDELRSPISWGVVRPTIVLDERIVGAAADAEAIIAHELAHVARLDWAKLLLARAVCALFWFNPLVWLLARESHQLREEAVDDAVLLSDIGRADYATLLVNAARHDNDGLLLAAHGVAPGRHSLRRRITRVLNQGLSRNRATGGFMLGGLILSAALIAPLAALNPLAKAAQANRTTPHATAPTALAAAPRAMQQVQRGARPRPPLTPEALTRLRAVGAQPADLRASEHIAGGQLSVEQVVQARAVGIDAEYASDLRAAFPDSTIGQIIQARAVNVDVAYARAMRAADPSLDLHDVIQARAIGVTPAYRAEMRQLFPGIGLSELSSMRSVGVTGDYVRAMRRHGSGYIEPSAVIRARAVNGGSVNIVTDGPPGHGRTVVTGPGGLRVEANAEADADSEADEAPDDAPPRRVHVHD